MPNSCRFKVNDQGLKPKTIYVNRLWLNLGVPTMTYELAGFTLRSQTSQPLYCTSGCIANTEIEQWTAILFIKLPTSYHTSYPYDIIHVADRQYVEQWMARRLTDYRNVHNPAQQSWSETISGLDRCRKLDECLVEATLTHLLLAAVPSYCYSCPLQSAVSSAQLLALTNSCFVSPMLIIQTAGLSKQ